MISGQLARRCLEASAMAYGPAERKRGGCVQVCRLDSELAHAVVVEADIEPGTSNLERRIRIIAFRGTDSLRGWVTDARVGWACMPFGRVHAGFMESCGSLLDQVMRLDQRERPAPVVLTGHSKGAAEALLCARHLAACGRPVAGVVTFGGPRVGDGCWRRSYNRQVANNAALLRDAATLGEITWRVVVEEDVVCRLPIWASGYRHVGSEVFYSNLRGWVARPRWWQKLASDLAGVLVDLHLRRVPLVVDHPLNRYEERVAELC